MFPAVIPLALLGLIVYGVVALVRRGHDRDVDLGGGGPGGSPVKRLFVYAMLFVSMIVAAIGLSGVIGLAISTAASRRGADLAAPLAMTIVGVPVFAGLAIWMWRTHAADRKERTSAGWALYINGALLVALGTAVAQAFTVADGIVDGRWGGTDVAGLLVWSSVWIGHWVAWRRIPPTTMPRTHLWLASGAGLWIMGGSLGFLIGNVAHRAFEAADTAVAVSDGADLQMAAAGVVIGGAVWAWHWLVNGRAANRSEGWYAYVLLFGVLAGLIAAVAGAGFGLYLVLEWLFGSPEAATAAAHFTDVSAAIAATAVGLGSWWYHRTVVGPSAARERTEVDRIYDYLVSGVALMTVATAAVILVLAVFEAIAPASATETGGGDGVDTLLAAVTLLLVGIPMWVITWRRLQGLAAATEEEAGSTTRRTYLLGIFGIGGTVAFGALIGLLVAVFRAMFGEGNGESLAGEIDVPVALLVTVGSGALYHWLVYRAERHLGARTPERDILLVGDGVVDIAEIATRVHARVRLLHRLDLPTGAAPTTDAIVDAIVHTQGDHLLVLAEANEVRVVPYE